MDVDIISPPSLTIEEIEIIMPDDSVAYIAGSHKWDMLETTSDLSAFFGRPFRLESNEWVINKCWVCADKSHIYYTEATLINPSATE